MKAWWWIALAACGGAKPTTTTTAGSGDVESLLAPPPAEVAAPEPAPPPPPPADATVVKVTEVPCGALELSPAASLACVPRVLERGAGPIAQVWQVPCSPNPLTLRDDGAVLFNFQGGQYRVDEQHPKSAGVPLSRRLEVSAVAAGTVFELLTSKAGESVLMHDGHCEVVPLPFVERAIAATRDGAVVMWGRDRDALRLVQRASDGSWRIDPPLPIAGTVATHLSEQDGAVISGYQTSNNGAAIEVGYYDAAHRMRPIRRIEAWNLQLVAAATPDEAPTAMYQTRTGFDVEVPDPQVGSRRLEHLFPTAACAQAEGYAPMPTGGFSHETLPALFRTGGRTWVAYIAWSGRCKFVKTSSRAAPPPFLFAHPPPPPPMWVASEAIDKTELVVVPIGKAAFGEPVRAPLPLVAPQVYAMPMPVVSASRIRLAFGTLIVDLDPARLGRAP